MSTENKSRDENDLLAVRTDRRGYVVDIFLSPFHQNLAGGIDDVGGLEHGIMGLYQGVVPVLGELVLLYANPHNPQL
jgi:hypothetical protein